MWALGSGRAARTAIAAMLAVLLAVGGGVDAASAAKPTSPGGGSGGGGGGDGGGDDGGSTGTVKVPSSFIARIHADALGRIPHQADWNALSDQFAVSGCDASTLASFARSVYTGTEFLGLYTENPPKLYALTRGALSREPQDPEFTDQLHALATGTTWEQVVDAVLASSDFASKAVEVCDPNRASYSYGGAPYPYGGTYSETTLREALSAAKPGETVTVPEQAMITLSDKLDIPYGVKLETYGIEGLAGRRAYARMARFVRADGYTGELLNVWAGADVENIWVDGLKAQHPDTNGGVNLLVRPTTVDTGTSTIQWVRADNPLGPQNVKVFGRETPHDDKLSGHCAGGVLVTENLLGQWANDNRRAGAHWADGVGSACSHTTITRNHVIDGSDVPIILWRSDSPDAQQSLVDSNVILNAGNDAFGGLAADPGAPTWYGQGQSSSFAGAEFTNNVLWTGQQVHYVIGLALGTRAWSFLSPWVNGDGGTFSGNTTGSSRARMQIAAYASGLMETTATANFDKKLVDLVSSGAGGHSPANTCGSAWMHRNRANSSGSLDGFTNGNHDGCI